MMGILRLSATNGRLTLAAILFVGFAALSVLGMNRGYHAVWDIWNIPQMTPHFADLRNLTGAAETIRSGYDPLVMNLADPWGRPLNQPRIMQYVVSGLDLRLEDTTRLGVIIISLFVAGIFLSLRPIRNATAWILAVVIFSPAVMLGIERANHDLFVFFLVALALAWPAGRLFSFAALMVATAVKLFPVFSVALFLRHDFRRFLVLAGLFMGLFGLYMLVNLSDLSQIFATTQKGYGVWAYGTKAFIQTPHLWQSYVPMMIVLPVLAGFVIWRWRTGTAQAGGAEEGSADHIDPFRVGAAIYMGTFFLGNNWNYRLMFLIFVIPQLVSWSKQKGRGVPSVVAIAAIVFSCWTLAFRELGFVIAVADELANWLLFFVLFYLMLVSVPQWARAPFANAAPAGRAD